MSLSHLPTDLLDVATFGGSAGVAFWAIRWFFEWMGGRMDQRQALIDNKTDLLIERLERRVDNLTDRLTVAEKDLLECKKLHLESEAELASLRQVGTVGCPHRDGSVCTVSS
jgi:hypothetical protein